MKKAITKLIPLPILSAYHFVLAWLATIIFGVPSRNITVVAVTGTKGKSSTIEYLNAIAEASGWNTALSSTIRFKIADASRPNRRRQTQPGRFLLQRFLYKAVRAQCSIVFIEMTSEGARQHRHRGIGLNALIFLNLAPEHIESHGSFTAYADAKFELGKQLARSYKRPRFIIANGEDSESGRYLSLPVEYALPFSLHATAFQTNEHGGTFMFEGETITVNLPGEFSLSNALAAATLMRALGVRTETIAAGIASLTRIPGRAEEIREGQPYTVVVDYAHTPDSLRAIYSSFPGRRKICVLGSTGGGRDMWKRPVMGGVADEFCDSIILTNEDPYDEHPRSIVNSIAAGLNTHTPDIIMDRREAIRHALMSARAGDVVLITGKGTDPTIQGPRGSSVPWSDAAVVREEIAKLKAS